MTTSPGQNVSGVLRMHDSRRYSGTDGTFKETRDINQTDYTDIPGEVISTSVIEEDNRTIEEIKVSDYLNTWMHARPIFTSSAELSTYCWLSHLAST